MFSSFSQQEAETFKNLVLVIKAALRRADDDLKKPELSHLIPDSFSSSSSSSSSSSIADVDMAIEDGGKEDKKSPKKKQRKE
jgi:hypothetical protein